MSVKTQLRIGPMGGVIGLDYNALQLAAGWQGVEMTAEAFDDIRVMEATMLSEFNRK